jgi:pilus assembly protein CpaC
MKRRGNRMNRLAYLSGAIAAVAIGFPAAIAANERQSMSLVAGESATIEHVKPGTAPAIHVIDNPNALLVNNQSPGKLILLGAARGEWDIQVVRDDGATIDYDVRVSGVANPSDPLAPANDSSKADLPPSMQRVSAYLSSQTSDYRANPTVAARNTYLNPSVNGGPNYLPAEDIDLMAGTSQVIDFPRKMKRISIADSTVADVQVVNPYQLNLVAHKAGFTTLAVWDDQGRYVERQVRIDTGGKQQVMLNVIVAELDRNAVENQGVNLSAALTNYGVSLVGLPGNVATPYSPSVSINPGGTTSSSTTTTSQSSGITATGAALPAGGQLIPLLLSSNLTYGLAAQNSNFATQSFFQFLEEHSLGKILAEPHLMANSGEEAKFLSGGEIPIVISQALNTSIVFKQFGTQVYFLPTVIGRRDIELLVKPEVSEPNYAQGVDLFGFNVPAFVTRRAETMVRMKDGQTLIIAVLILHNKNATIQKVPYLGDIPYLGGLFRNTTWNDSDTDLVMSVTPQIVEPIPDGGSIALPTNVPELTNEDIKTQRLAVPDASRPRF